MMKRSKEEESSEFKSRTEMELFFKKKVNEKNRKIVELEGQLREGESLKRLNRVNADN